MNGPQHFAAAEQALAAATDATTKSLEFERHARLASLHLQAAQVAATIDTARAGLYGHGADYDRMEAWHEATAPDPERAR